MLNGVASFGSGGRYADYTGITFVFEGERAPHLALVRTDQKGVRIDPTWKAMSLRASATDHVHYEDVRAPARVGGAVPAAVPRRFPRSVLRNDR